MGNDHYGYHSPPRFSNGMASWADNLNPVRSLDNSDTEAEPGTPPLLLDYSDPEADSRLSWMVDLNSTREIVFDDALISKGESTFDEVE